MHTMPEQITKALKYLGMKENDSHDKTILKLLLGIDPSTTAWCAAFVNAIEKQCGRKGTGKLNARSFLDYGAPVKEPQVGDICVFRRGSSSWQGHVAYFIAIEDEGILVLGGNQGDSVCYKHYSKDALLGYRRP